MILTSYEEVWTLPAGPELDAYVALAAGVMAEVPDFVGPDMSDDEESVLREFVARYSTDWAAAMDAATRTELFRKGGPAKQGCELGFTSQSWSVHYWGHGPEQKNGHEYGLWPYTSAPTGPHAVALAVIRMNAAKVREVISWGPRVAV